MADLITLSSQIGHAPSNHGESRNVGYQPMCDHTKYINKMANGSKDTFDGYEFKTDWNGKLQSYAYSYQVICLLTRPRRWTAVYKRATQLLKTERCTTSCGTGATQIYGYLM